MSDITLTPEQAAPRIASLLSAHESKTLEFKRMGDSKVVKLFFYSYSPILEILVL